MMKELAAIIQTCRSINYATKKSTRAKFKKNNKSLRYSKLTRRKKSTKKMQKIKNLKKSPKMNEQVS